MKTRNKKVAREQAEDVYIEEHREAIELTWRLGELLLDVPVPDDGRAINWADVGTMQDIKQRLAAVEDVLKRAKW